MVQKRTESKLVRRSRIKKSVYLSAMRIRNTTYLFLLFTVLCSRALSQGEVSFTYERESRCSAVVQFTDTSPDAQSWAWSFGDGNTSSEQHPLYTYFSAGEYDVVLVITDSEGNEWSIVEEAVSVQFLLPPVPVTDYYYSCSPASFALQAQASGSIEWYNAATGGVLQQTGATYVTPILEASAEIFVQTTDNVGVVRVGEATNTIGAGGFYTGGTFHYLTFNTSEALTLYRVKAYANSAGPRSIQLRTFSGQIIQQLTVDLLEGENTIELNFSIPQGSGLQLGSLAGNGLYRNTEGASYPYVVDDLVTITGNSAQNLSAYYFFYDWEVGNLCTSAREDVRIEIGIQDEITATLSTGTTVGCPGDSIGFVAGTEVVAATYFWYVNNELVFTDSSDSLSITSTYSSTTWNTGDEVYCVIQSSDACDIGSPATSNSFTIELLPVPETPVVSFVTSTLLQSSSETGNQWYYEGTLLPGATGQQYQVVDEQGGVYYCIVTLGCSSAPSNEVEVVFISVNEAERSTPIVYPNPATDLFTLRWAQAGQFQISVLDAFGRELETRLAVDEEHFDTRYWAKGVYVLQVSSENESHTVRLAKE
jgi:PKD repeat protein